MRHGLSDDSFVPRQSYARLHLSIEERDGGTLSCVQKGSSFKGADRSFLLFGFPRPRNRMADKMRYNVPSTAVAAAVSLPKCGAANANIRAAPSRRSSFPRPLVPSDALARKMSPAYRRRTRCCRRQPNHRNLDIQYTFSCTRGGAAEGRPSSFALLLRAFRLFERQTRRERRMQKKWQSEGGE